MFESYWSAVRFLEGLGNLPVTHDYMRNRENPGIYLKRMRFFLELLGNPDRGFKIVHVTGTAGKGSVSTLIHETLTAAGKISGLVTSPAVTSTVERVRVGLDYIPPAEFARIIEEMKPALDKAYLESPYGRPSYFEITLAVAFLYFKKMKCEWLVLEVGCGGRFDYTNVIGHSDISVITNIDWDHMEFLGKTLKKIAYEKIGIVKPKSVFFTTERRPALLNMFKKICAEQKTEFNKLAPAGDHTARNNALASAVLERIGIKKELIERVAAKIRVPCRFETIQKNPQVIVDGAHNPIKMKSTVDNLAKLSYRKLILVLGLGESKDADAVLSEIIPLADLLFITRYNVKEKKCAAPRMLAEIARKYAKHGVKSEIHLDPFAALDRALAAAKKDDLVLVTGSFYLAGELRTRWVSEEKILKTLRSF